MSNSRGVSKFLSTLLVAKFFFVIGTAHAAPSSNWQRIERQAITANPEIQSMTAEMEASRANESAAYSGFWPQLSLFADETKKDTRKPSYFLNPLTNTVDITSTPNSAQVQSYGLKGSIELFSGFSTLSLVRKNNAALEASRQQLVLKSIEIRYELLSAYIQWIMAEKSLKTSEDILKREKQNRGLIKIKYDNGLEAKWALDQIDISLQLSEVSIESDRQTAQEAQERLKTLLQADVPNLDDNNLLSLQDLGNINESDLQSHPQILYFQSLQKQADASRDVIKSEFYPNLQASYSWVHSKERSDEANTEKVVALTLTWNIFSGFSSRQRLASATASKLAADWNEKTVREQLKLDLWLQKKNYDLSRETLRLKNLELKNAHLRAETVSSQYRNGLRRYADWEAAQNKLINLERDLINLEKQALLQKALWEKTVGKKLGDS